MVGKIKGTGSYRPVQVWDNDKLSHMMDTSDEWIRGRTGIGQRHIASGGETVAYMAARAAEEALSDAGMRPEEIDLLLVSTMSSERIMPCAACEVQKLIGAVNAACFDLNGACTGFLLALNTAQAYLGQQIYRRALVIGSEILQVFIKMFCLLQQMQTQNLLTGMTEQAAYCLAMAPVRWCWKRKKMQSIPRLFILLEVKAKPLPVSAAISSNL